MKRFRFRLQTVLRVRSHESAVAINAYQIAQGRVRELQAALTDAHEQRLAYAAQLAERRGQGMTAFQWALTWEHQTTLGKVEEAAAGELQQMLVSLRERRRELSEARRRERTLEQLREKHFEQFRQEELATEQSMLDEVSQFRAFRNAQGGGAL